MTGDFQERDEGATSSLQRAIVLLLLDRRGDPRPRVELHDALLDCGGADLDAALDDLEREGVIELTSSQARASRATRRLDALNLIGI